MKTREYMMDQLEAAWGMDFVAITENFNGTEGGIWLSAENGETDPLDGNIRLFDYWNESYAKYEHGVYNRLSEWAQECGWWFEWNDPGTIMLWPND
jgi:hypothetical protein